MFDGSGRLIGLHHTGFGQTSDMEARTKKLNTAVRLDKILNYLESAPGSAECGAGLHRLLTVER